MTLVDHAGRTSTLIWIALVALTLTSFALSEGSSARGAAVPILIVAGVKASLVGFGFMELRSAHPAWKAAFASLVTLIVIVLSAMRLAGA